MLAGTIGDAVTFGNIVRSFDADPTLMMVGPEPIYKSGRKLIRVNQPLCEKVTKTLLGSDLPSEWGFFAGTMFWARISVFADLADRWKGLEDVLPFEEEPIGEDGALPHAFERAFGAVPVVLGGKIGLVDINTGTVSTHVAPGPINMESMDNQFGPPPSKARASATQISPQVGSMEPEAKNSQAFDSDWYRSHYADVDMLGMDPLKHYLWIGKRLGRAPNEKALLEQLAVRPTKPTAEDTPAPAERSTAIFVSGEPLSRPGYFYRVERYAKAAARIGLRTATLTMGDLKSGRPLIKSAKFVYIWRAIWGPDLASFVQEAQRVGVPVVFDVDDLMVRPELATAEYIDAIRFNNFDPENVKRHYGKIRQTMVSVDFCTASTAELAWHMRKAPQPKPTFVLPNGYAEETYLLSRAAARAKPQDGLIRIGYASGTRTHQADFKVCAPAVAAVLREREDCRLVLFRRDTLTTLDLAEFPEFAGLEDRIEWRSFVDHHLLPTEVARFDINLAPLEVGNPFCEAKSELKFFEAAICDVPTIASPTGPFARAIDDGETGFLATTTEEWLVALQTLVSNADLRHKIGREAHRRALWPFGPLRRVDLVQSMIDQIDGGRRGAATFSRDVGLSDLPRRTVPLADRAIIFEHDDGRPAKASVVVPLFNYENYVVEALDSVAAQTLNDIELIVVDDCSTDQSGALVMEWMTRHRDRFRRMVLACHRENQGLGASRNTAFDLADTLHVMTLDADNRLLPGCCERLLSIMDREGAAFVYPTIRQFGDGSARMGEAPYRPAALIPGNYIDAMALISKEAWAAVGGCSTSRLGWEDYDLWCRFAERGFHGVHASEVLAEYRVHQSSMLRTATDKQKNKAALVEQMERDHPWLNLVEQEGPRCPAS